MPKGQPGTRSPHGTVTRYFGQGCRCDECREAMRRYHGCRPWDEYNAERVARADATHGTEWTYVRGCRCALCREASRAARARRRARAAA